MLLILYWIERSWVNESRELLPEGRTLRRYNYWEFRSSATVAFCAFPLSAYCVYKFKERSLILYAFVEILVGIAAGGVALLVLRFDNVAHWVALLAAAYIVVRGLENWSKARIAATAPASQSAASSSH